MRLLSALIGTCLIGAATWSTHSVAQDTVTIYYCTDAAGNEMISDRACPKGQQQRTRQLPKPRPASPRPAPMAPVTAAPPPPPAPQVVVVQAPRPLYECVTPEGDSYTSDSPEGRPRFVPLWTLGYPVLAESTVYSPGGGHIRYSDGRISGGLHTGSVRHVVTPTAAGYGAGTWVRDACHALPQREVCARLHNELDDLRTRFFNAMPSERDRITTQERSITERLASDCTP